MREQPTSTALARTEDTPSPVVQSMDAEVVSARDLSLFGALRAAASEIFSRANIAKYAGLSFKDKRDLYEGLGYDRVLVAKQLRSRYERGDVAARIVDTYPKETWAGEIELIEDQDPQKETEFEKAVSELVKKHRLWNRLRRADVLAGLGRWSVLLIGAPGNLEEELPTLSGPDDILYFACYGEEEATVIDFDENPASERYGLPLSYNIRRKGGRTAFQRKVHWSRCIHIADNLLDDRTTGNPLLIRCWNRLDDLDKVVGGGSEAYWLRVHQGTVFNINPELKVEKPDMDLMRAQAEEFAHGMRRTLVARGFDTKVMGSDVSNFGQQVASIISLLSSATGIPQRILMGSERGELASSQDKNAWDDRIADRRSDYAEPIIRDLFERLMTAGALPQVEEFEIRWPEQEEMTISERATVADQLSKLNGQAGGTVIMPEEIREQYLDMEPLTDEQQAQIAEQEEQERQQKADELAAQLANRPPAEPIAAREREEDFDRELRVSLDMPPELSDALRTLAERVKPA